MQILPFNLNRTRILFLLIFLLSGISYGIFASYRPKALTQLQEVKGISVSIRNIFEDSADFVYPLGSKEIGRSKKADGSQVTIETSKSPEDVQKFYLNIFMTRGWRVENTVTEDNLYRTEYKKANERISVTSSRPEGSENTVANVSISRF